MQDASLLFSSASALRPALPFALITSERHYIPSYTLQAATTPAGIEISKYYCKRDVEAIQKDLSDALSRGSAAAEEWSKGLEARGLERMRVVEQWERWEVKYQWRAHTSSKQAAALTASHPGPVEKEKSKSPARKVSSPVIHSPVPTGTFFSTSDLAKDESLLRRLSGTPHSYPTAVATPFRFLPSRPPTVPHQYTPQPGSNSSGLPTQRNLHDANESKANRRAEIERRCRDINPPIPPNVLRHMDSFKAALHISRPMTEDDWAVLEPRLVAQLPAAQQAEADHVARTASVSKLPERRPPDNNTKEAKEIMDREWDEVQRPVRDRLSAIADNFINQDWDEGRAVTYENSPKFAVDLLVYVRRRIYSGDVEKQGTAEDWVVKSALESSKPRLVLENMKWVYDNKIKPLTEQYRKEIFLCNGPGCESNFKYYGFEGVIMHFGAKHTNAFSVGNVVVAWREAEWPADTPFHPDPISAKHTYHATPSTSGHAGYGAYYGGYSRAGTSTPHTQAHLPQASPGPYHYAGHYNGPFAPPQIHSSATPGFDYNNQAYGVPMDTYPYQSMAPPGFGSQPGNGYIASPAMSIPAMAALSSNRPIPGTDDTTLKPEQGEHRTSLFDKQVSTIISVAQDVWKQTSGIKDLPNNLRVYVLLQRVISRFHVEFNHEPNLNHIIDAFSNHEIPRALKNAPGLSCKTCQDEPSHQHPAQEERRTYVAFSLFTHFRSHLSSGHVPFYANGQPRKALDWKEDMIELPSDRFISGLIHAPGMNDDKLHMIATVFPRLFPTPLPKIGNIEEDDVALHDKSISKDSNPNLKDEPSDKSGPAPLASPYAGPPNPVMDEYDPQRPTLSGLGSQPAVHTNRRDSYRGNSPEERKPRYYSESYQQHGQAQYYVGLFSTYREQGEGADSSRDQLPREHLDREYYHPEDQLDYPPNHRRYREARPFHEEYHDRQPMYRDHEGFYRPMEDESLAYSHHGAHAPEYRIPSRQARYPEATAYYASETRYIREPRAQAINPSEEDSVADLLPEDFAPSRPPTNEHLDARNKIAADPELDDGSRYSPPPVNGPEAAVATGQFHFGEPAQPPPPSTVSNGSRYEETRPPRRPLRTPDFARGPRRPGPQRRRDRHDHPTSRYYRYMSVAREEPYSRGASISRAQSKRYEEQRRRIDEQETPQPNADREEYSRDHSMERVPADDPAHTGRPVPRGEYVSVQDRLNPMSSPRYRYTRYSEEAPRPGPIYIDEQGYEVVRIPRESHPARGTYGPEYLEHEHDNVRYVPVPYERPYSHSHRYDDAQRVYYDERERLPSARKPSYVPEVAYEPSLPEIKVESVAPVTEAP